MFHEVWELERFQIAKVTLKVIQGHWKWCHSIGHIRFPTSLLLQLSLPCTVNEILSLIIKNLKSSRASEQISLRYYIMPAQVLRCINQHTKFGEPSFSNSKDMTGAKFQKSHATLTTPNTEYFVTPRLAIDILYLHTKFGDYRFSCSTDMIAGIENENGSHDHDYAPFRGGFSSIGSDMIVYLCKKFDHSNISHSRNIVDAHQIYGSCDLITPLSGMVCQLRVSNCHDQPTYQI